jgi:predicted esterase
MERAGPEPAGARAVAILVHGRDQDEAVMLDVAQRLRVPDVAYLLPVSPQRSWYPARYFDPRADNEPHLTQAMDAIEGAITAAGVPDDRLVLAGFSQGACLIADFVARGGPRRYAGVGILTGSLIGAESERATPDAAPGLPMVFTCGRHDEWIPIDDARATADVFARAGAATSFVELDDRVHHVSDAAVDALRALLTAVA